MINEQSILGEAIFALVFITGCGSADGGLTPTQQVYEVIMNERMQDPLREVIILSETEGQLLADANIEGLAYHIELAGGVPDNLVVLLIASANESKALNWQPVMVNAKFVKKDDISSHLNWGSMEFWESFFGKFPDQNEFYGLSDVAFNYDYSEAALLVSYFCPVMCGGGQFLVYLEKSDMQWNIVGSSAFFIT